METELLGIYWLSLYGGGNTMIKSKQAFTTVPTLARMHAMASAILVLSFTVVSCVSISEPETPVEVEIIVELDPRSLVNDAPAGIPFVLITVPPKPAPKPPPKKD